MKLISKVIIGCISVLIFLSYANAQELENNYLCAEAESQGIVKYDSYYLKDGEFSSTSVGDNNSLIIDEEILNYIERLRENLLNQGTIMSLLLVPARPHLIVNSSSPEGESFDAMDARAAYTTLVEAFNRIKVISPNIVQYSLQKELEDNFFRLADAHQTPYGSLIMSEALFESLKSILGADPETIFYLEETETITGKGNVAKELEDICGIETFFKDDATPVYTAFPEKVVGLFDDEKTSIALAGTSQSGIRYSLAEYIKLSLGRDVTNYSVGGGGAFSSLRLAITDAKNNDYPQILIWEMAARHTQQKQLRGSHGFLDPVMYRQLLPLTSLHDCEVPLYTSSIAVGESMQKIDLLDNNRIEIANNQDYIRLIFTDTSINSFTVDINYETGFEKVEMKRSTRTKNDGVFYLELASDELLDITLSPETGHSLSGTITLDVCKF